MRRIKLANRFRECATADKLASTDHFYVARNDVLFADARRLDKWGGNPPPARNTVAISEFRNIRLTVMQIRSISDPVPSPHEGRFAIVTIRRAWDAMAAVASGMFACQTKRRSGRRSRVVLAPRPWRYVGGKPPAGNGGKKGRFPGESTYKP